MGRIPFFPTGIPGRPIPSISRSRVPWRIAPRIRSPVNTGLVMMRVRAAWMRSNISASDEYCNSSMPYMRSGLDVLPSLWSSAAMKLSALESERHRPPAGPSDDRRVRRNASRVVDTHRRAARMLVSRANLHRGRTDHSRFGVVGQCRQAPQRGLERPDGLYRHLEIPGGRPANGAPVEHRRRRAGGHRRARWRESRRDGLPDRVLPVLAAAVGPGRLRVRQFGENFTITGLADSDVCIGDRYRIGTAEF